MSTLVESLKRLYLRGRLTKEQIGKRVTKGTITETEYEYITDEKYANTEEAS
ncbi:XkdX family protein [Criibacterium bergeronii]|uniref:XkdX family protein n=1 Tax=Criibacterium bergeronii TaxID=1871336 RepID=A0A371ILV6_9FIRM|nr:XkdX family protein [Criibacterium bergeronii]RDY21451.1 XkdX family protein [Criibacterium bergeronii]